MPEGTSLRRKLLKLSKRSRGFLGTAWGIACITALYTWFNAGQPFITGPFLREQGATLGGFFITGFATVWSLLWVLVNWLGYQPFDEKIARSTEKFGKINFLVLYILYLLTVVGQGICFYKAIEAIALADKPQGSFALFVRMSDPAIWLAAWFLLPLKNFIYKYYPESIPSAYKEGAQLGMASVVLVIGGGLAIGFADGFAAETWFYGVTFVLCFVISSTLVRFLLPNKGERPISVAKMNLTRHLGLFVGLGIWLLYEKLTGKQELNLWPTWEEIDLQTFVYLGLVSFVIAFVFVLRYAFIGSLGLKAFALTGPITGVCACLWAPICGELILQGDLWWLKLFGIVFVLLGLLLHARKTWLVEERKRAADKEHDRKFRRNVLQRLSHRSAIRKWWQSHDDDSSHG